LVERSRQHGRQHVIGPMRVLVAIVLVWLSLRTLLLLNQVSKHTPEAQLGREFRGELRARGLLPDEERPQGDR